MEGEGGEKKEVRRPMNAFLIFCKRHRSVVREKNPDMDNRSVTRVLGDLWANLGEEKATYTNLAKQYKDAFMKANPNYKWHSSDKSHSATGKMVAKPTNSRVIKNVAELSPEGGITPGKLADPEKMGGLNLLLMADKETSHDAKTSSSSSSASQMFSSSTAASRNSEQTSSSTSALLQLAEMCTSELEGSGSERPSSLPHPLSQRPPPFSCSNQTDLHSNPQQPMPPPKKRARHWSLSEPDNPDARDLPSDDGGMGYNNYSNVNLSPLNLSMHKPRYTTPQLTDEKYSSVEKYKSTSGRKRKLSSSATESIPSPTPPYADEAESPVFCPVADRSDNSGFSMSKLACQGRGYCEARQQDCHSASSGSRKIETLFSDLQQPVQPRSLFGTTGQPQAPPTSKTQLLQHHMSSPSSQSPKLSQLVQQNPHLPSNENDQSLNQCNVQIHPFTPSTLSRSSQYGGDVKQEKSNPDFYQWREPGKPRAQPGAGDSLPSTLRPTANLCTSESPSAFCAIKPAHATPQQSPFEDISRFARYEPATETQAKPIGVQMTSSMNIERETKSLPSVTSFNDKKDDKPYITEGKIASLLSSSDGPGAKLTLGHPASFQESFGSQQKSVENERREPQSGGIQTNHGKIDNCQGALKLPSSGHSQTFSEGKLKKKWAQRMLVEAKMEEELHQQSMQEKGADHDTSSKLASFDLNPNPRGLFLPNIKPQFPSNAAFSDNKMSLKTEHHLHPLHTRMTESESFNQTQNSGKLILNQPLDSMKSTIPQRQSPTSFSASSHPKLMLQLSQNQAPPRPKIGQAFSQSHFNCTIPKSEPVSVTPADLFKGQKSINIGRQIADGNKLNRCINQGQGDQQVLSPITACGKKIVDHIVQQFFKSDFSGDKSLDNPSFVDGLKGLPGSLKGLPLNAVKREDLESSKRWDIEGVKEQKTDGWIKKEDSQEFKGLTASSLVERVVREVCGSPPGKDGCSSCRKSDQAENTSGQPLVKDTILSPAASDSLPVSTATAGLEKEVSATWDSRRTSSSPSNETDSQSQWSLLTPESCDEDVTMQPVRKSRRRNRGQKYQELIKEGFIQPSRERMAARNAERHGRSFGTREEFDKMEVKRTLKRSASEITDRAAAVRGGSVSAEAGLGEEEKFATGDFDLEKEIKSLPVCSLDQLQKKKMPRRRCDSETLMSAPRHRSNSDVTASVSPVPPGRTSPKLSPTLSSGSKCPAENDKGDCPATHIPIPKEERTAELVTGSRKRKARKHCITRISVLEEGTTNQNTEKEKNSTLEPIHEIKKNSQASTKTIDSRKANNSQTASKNKSSKQHGIPKSSTSSSEPSTVFLSSSTVKTSSSLLSLSPSLTQPSSQNTSKSLFTAVTSSIPHTFANRPVSLSSASSTDKEHSVSVTAQHSSKGKPIDGLQVKPASFICSSLFSMAFPSEKEGTVLPAATNCPETAATGKSLSLNSESGANISNTSSPNEGKSLSSTSLPKDQGTVPKQSKKAKKTLSKDLPASSPELKNKKSEKISPKEKTSSCRKDKKNARRNTKTSVPSTQSLVVSTLLYPANSQSVEKHGTQVSVSTPHIPIQASQNILASLAASRKAARVNNSPMDKAIPELPSSQICHTGQLAPISPPDAIIATNPSPLKTLAQNESPLTNLSNAALSVKEVVKVFSRPLTGAPQKSVLPAVTKSPKPLQPSTIPAVGIEPTATMTICTVPQTSPATSGQPSFSCVGSISKPQPWKAAPLFSMKDKVSKQELGSGSPLQVPKTVSSNFDTCDDSVSKTVPYPSIQCSSSHSTQPSSSLSSSITGDLSTFSSLSASSLPSSSSATVISLATSTASTMGDVVSYTVIGSSTVMEAGSPHMIGSPHLPESPSIAFVQS